MIKRVLEQKGHFLKSCLLTRKPDHLSSPGRTYRSWRRSRKLWNPFKTSQTCAPPVQQVSWHLKRAILSCGNPSSPALFKKLNTKYADLSTSDLLDIASLLEPCFKARHISGEKLDAPKHKVITEAESLPSGPASCLSEPADQKEAAVAGPPTSKKNNSGELLWAHIYYHKQDAHTEGCSWNWAFKLLVGSLCRRWFRPSETVEEPWS